MQAIELILDIPSLNFSEVQILIASEDKTKQNIKLNSEELIGEKVLITVVGMDGLSKGESL